MRNFNLIRSILTEPWYISPDQARILSPLVMGVLEPERISFVERGAEFKASVSYTASATGGGSGDQGRIGVVEINGPLYKYDSLCHYGMQSYGAFIQEHDRDPAIDAIVLVIDSPGGSVAGTNEICQTIQSCAKPVVAFVSDMACSAAYRIASSCRQVVANNSMANVGSIGVMCSYTDMSEYYARMGIKRRDIYAPESGEKNGAYRELEKGNTKPIEENLSQYAQEFHQAVKGNRPGVTDDQLKGKVYFAKDVIGSLVDSIDTFEGACRTALDLAAPVAGEKSANQSQNNMKKQNMYALLAVAAGVEAFESADGDITLTAEQCQAVEERIGALEAEASAAAAAREQLTEAQAQIAELEGENAELRALPGADHSSVEKETDATSDTGTFETFGALLNNAIANHEKYDI